MRELSQFRTIGKLGGRILTASAISFCLRDWRGE